MRVPSAIICRVDTVVYRMISVVKLSEYMSIGVLYFVNLAVWYLAGTCWSMIIHSERIWGLSM